ncbi:MAG: peptidoglycan bridge formation glycyltransferase FemA/FemB family protein [Patescibacteria group bacterium]
MKLHIETISDQHIWDRFWEMHAPGALFQSWAWGEVVLRQSRPLTRFGLYDGSTLVGIYQIMIVRARRGTYLHIRHGPILVTQALRYWQRILTHLQSLAGTEHAWFARLSPQINDTKEYRALFDTLRLKSSILHEVDAERCIVLPLDPSEDELLSGMRKTTRYEIRRFEKMGIHVVRSTDPADLDKFYDLYRQTSARQHFVEHAGIREEFEVYTKEGNAVLLLGYHEQTLLSAAIILFSGSEAIYHHGASTHTKFPVNYAVQWEAIRMAKKRGLKSYNFWGVAPEGNLTHPWSGHSLFKRGFGGLEVVKIHAHDFPTSGLYGFTRMIEWWEERRRGY